ncbi:MAG: GntR family transcriptional regulator [Armatimonadota bacterium]
MLLRIREDSDSPIYQQIIDQVKAQIADGAIEKGDKLPSVRELAADLSINVNTVYKAYKELEVQGIVRMRVGFGVTVIAERGDRLREDDKEKIIEEMVDHLRVEAYHLGFDDNYLINLLKRRMEEHKA